MSELTTEMGRLSAVDCRSTFEPMKSSISGVTNGLKALGMLNDEQTQTLQKVEGALSLVTGMLGLAVAAKAIQETKTTIEEAKAVTLTAANSLTPVGWGKIALAGAVAGATSIALYTAVNNINLGSFNLSTAEGQQSATDAVIEAI